MRTFRVAAIATLLVLTLLTLIPGPARAEDPPIPPLTDLDGRVLTIRGWNVEDKAHHGEHALTGITERHFRDLAASGFNTARVLFFWQDLEPAPGAYSSVYLARIEQILEWAERYDVQVILDAHQDVYGEEFGSGGIPAWATRTDGLPFEETPGDWFAGYFQPAVMRAFTHLYTDADLQQAQADMWRVVASAVGDHPALLGYDTLNEPMGELLEGEDLPTAANRLESTLITVMHQRVVDAIRDVDAESWVFIEPTPIVGEGLPTGLGAISGERVAYAPHFYSTAQEYGGDYDPALGWVERYEEAVSLYPAEQRMPVVVGEWGPMDSTTPNAPVYFRDILASMSRFSSGWTAYVWCYGGGYCALDPSGEFNENKDATVQPYAAAVAGTSISRSWDPDARTFRLRFRPAGRGGVTELRVPGGPTSPAGGWRVDVRGPVKVGERPGPDGARIVSLTQRGRANGWVDVAVTQAGQD